MVGKVLAGEDVVEVWRTAVCDDQPVYRDWEAISVFNISGWLFIWRVGEFFRPYLLDVP